QTVRWLTDSFRGSLARPDEARAPEPIRGGTAQPQPCSSARYRVASRLACAHRRSVPHTVAGRQVRTPRDQAGAAEVCDLLPPPPTHATSPKGVQSQARVIRIILPGAVVRKGR